MRGWRCTITDPASGRDAYVRNHSGTAYEIAIPCHNVLEGKGGVTEAAQDLRALASALIAGAAATLKNPAHVAAFASGVKVHDKISVQAPPHNCIEVAVLVFFPHPPTKPNAERAYPGDVHDFTLNNLFEEYVKTLKKAKAKP